MRHYLLIALLACTITATAQTNSEQNFMSAKNLETFNSVCRVLDMMYVDTINADKTVAYGINAMLASLDPYTAYYPEDKTKELKSMMTGKYAGIGAIIHRDFKRGRTAIWEPYAGMPAAEVGLKRGDIILSIDDEDMTDKTNDYVSSHLRGKPGTSFMLKILRPTTGKTMKMKVTRRSIQLPSITYYGVKDSIGYIALNSFTENCARDIRNYFVMMRNQGIKGLILDLRSNGGGLEQEAVNLVNIFVPKGQMVVENRGRMTRLNHKYSTTVEPVDTVMPVVVMVNGNTASSSEITSGALQDLDRAVILGTRTFGKGLVQVPLDLPYNGTIKLTTSKYYIPSGRCIQAINYKHGEDDKWMEKVPDSLTKVFYTAHGRQVRDGKGIMPDVEVRPDSMSNIADYLFTRIDSLNLVGDYEMDYVARHPSIAPAGEFSISDADYEDFKQRVINSGFKYDQITEKYLANLKKMATFEGYYDDAKPEFDALEKKLKHNLAHDLDYHKDEIKEMLSNDIVCCYYFQAGAAENMLRTDKQYQKAVSLLKNPTEYRKLLEPAKKK